jgi:predicted secreted protein
VIAGAVHGAVLLSAFLGFFFLSLFCLIPVGLGAVDPNTGAPLSPRIGTKVLIALGIAVVLWVIFYAALRTGIVQL